MKRPRKEIGGAAKRREDARYRTLVIAARSWAKETRVVSGATFREVRIVQVFRELAPFAVLDAFERGELTWRAAWRAVL